MGLLVQVSASAVKKTKATEVALVFDFETTLDSFA